MGIVLGMALGTIAGGLIGLVVFVSHGNWFFVGVSIIQILVGSGIALEIRRAR